MSEIGREMAIEGIERVMWHMKQEEAFRLLALRLGHARSKHPEFADSNRAAWAVIASELKELSRAIDAEGPVRIMDEALDVAATAMRLVMGEVQA